MSLSDRQHEFALDVSFLIAKIYQDGMKCSLGEAFRTPEQAAIYAKDGRGIADSLHCSRLAIDLNLFNANGEYLSDSKDYEKFGIYWESLHAANRWGGRFKRADGNHFERQDK